MLEGEVVKVYWIRATSIDWKLIGFVHAFYFQIMYPAEPVKQLSPRISVMTRILFLHRFENGDPLFEILGCHLESVGGLKSGTTAGLAHTTSSKKVGVDIRCKN